MDAYAYRNEYRYDFAWLLIAATLLQGIRIQLLQCKDLRVVPNVREKKVRFLGGTITSISMLYLTIAPRELTRQDQQLLDSEVYATFGDAVVTTLKLSSGIFVHSTPQTTYTGKVFDCSWYVERVVLFFTNKRDLKKSIKNTLGGHVTDVRDRDEIIKTLVGLMSL